MVALSTVIFPDVLRSIESTGVSSDYAPVGSALTYPTRIVKFTNNTTEDVTLSWDGINDHDYIPAGSFLLLDVSTNHENSLVFDIRQGTQFFVKGTAGTGYFYISSYYGV